MQHTLSNPTQPGADVSQVELDGLHFSSARRGALRLPGDLEEQFRSDRAGTRRRQLTIGGLIALAIFDMFIVGDYLMAPDHLMRAIVMRFGVITPLVLLITLLLQREERIAVQEACAAMLCVVGGAAVLYLHHGVNTATTMQAEPGLLLVLLAMNALLRPDFWLSCTATALLYGEYLVFLAHDKQTSLSQQFTTGGRVFWFAVLSLTTNYALAREQRFSWLQQLRNRVQRRMLTDTNRELLNLSYTDRLTGLPNRAAYDKRLTELWQEAADNGSYVTAVMVDVDHFKSINDDFGHLYGDRVLQRIATLLEQAMRSEGDFAARFGGEEFIVLLPDSDLHSGSQVAERIRLLVQVAGSPAVSRAEAVPSQNIRWSTVSCGVACARPSEVSHPKYLIDAADDALYRAKETGRNRVCTHAGSIEENPSD